MRVIAGLAKGHQLFSPEGEDTRPTLDRVKESVFSILYPYLRDAVVLDLFAGTGSLGIEALSRGAEYADFVDNGKKAYDCIIRNLRKTRLEEKSKVHFTAFEKFLKAAANKYDIVFLDPPYNKGIEDKVFESVAEVLNKDAVVVLETEYVGKAYDGFEIIKQAKYGRVYITLYRQTESAL